MANRSDKETSRDAATWRLARNGRSAGEPPARRTPKAVVKSSNPLDSGVQRVYNMSGGDRMQSVRVQIRITQDILDKLDKMAAEHGLTRSAMIRLLIVSSPMGMVDYDPSPLEINDQ